MRFRSRAARSTGTGRSSAASSLAKASVASSMPCISSRSVDAFSLCSRSSMNSARSLRRVSMVLRSCETAASSNVRSSTRRRMRAVMRLKARVARRSSRGPCSGRGGGPASSPSRSAASAKRRNGRVIRCAPHTSASTTSNAVSPSQKNTPGRGPRGGRMANSAHVPPSSPTATSRRGLPCRPSTVPCSLSRISTGRGRSRSRWRAAPSSTCSGDCHSTPCGRPGSIRTRNRRSESAVSRRCLSSAGTCSSTSTIATTRTDRVRAKCSAARSRRSS